MARRPRTERPPTTPARGMRDLLPSQVRLRDHCEAIIRRRYAAFGFNRVETPALEHLALLTGGQGGDNEKLIYKVLKRGEKLDLAHARGADELADYGLRYDLTVPLARYFAHNRGQLPTPFKSLQVGSVWRAERPQKGRYRQFTQCDIDVLGQADVGAEIDLILATASTLADLGLSGFIVRLNDRRLLSRLVAAAGLPPEQEPGVLVTLDKLDKLGADGVAAELEAAGHPRQAVAKLLAVIADGTEGLARVARGDHTANQAMADLVRIARAFDHGFPGRATVELDASLVRGMGYYTGPVFEAQLPGYGFSLAGGGRYDDMLGRLIGQPVPACGFSIGFERVVLVLEERGTPAGEGDRLALLYDARRDDPGAVAEAAARLRAETAGAVSMLPSRKNLTAQLDELARHGFDRFARFSADGPLTPRSLSSEPPRG